MIAGMFVWRKQTQERGQALNRKSVTKSRAQYLLS